MVDAKQYIQDIQNRIRKSDKEFVLDGYAGSIESVQKAFPRYGSFLMEFIQNADDAKSKLLRIEIFQDSIKVLNDGLPFSQEDVKSICKVGRSSKITKDYIGYLGVGFKAVFLISTCPEIYSGEYRFKFDKAHWSDSNIPWQVIPLWIDNPQIELTQGFNTIFNLPLKSINLVEMLQNEIKPEHLSDRILLFLRHIEKLELIDHTQNFKRRIIKSKVSETSDFEIYQIQEYENDNLKNQDQWLIFRSSCEVPENVKQDSVSKEWGRGEVNKREVLVAFKLDKENYLVKEEKGTAHIGVFSFLPLKEIPSGLNFLIQADFLTMTGRGELARECLWNSWLADEINKLIIDKCIPIFLREEKWKMNFTELLYSSKGGHELFESHIKDPLRRYIENNEILIAEDGSTIKLKEAISVESDILDLLDKDDLKKLYPDKKIIHPECKVPLEIQNQLEKGPTFNAHIGISTKMQELIKLKAQQKNIEFFKKFYRKLDFAESTLKHSPLRTQNIIVTDSWSLSDSSSIYIKPENVVIPDEIKENFKIVHSDLTKESKILEILKILGVEELTEDHIQNFLKTKEIPTMSKNWTSFSDLQKVEKIKLCKELWEKGQINVRDIAFLTLKTKNGKWLPPNELVFSSEYKPEHSIETLKKKGVLDFPIEFVSSDFVKDKNNDEIKRWYDFFKEIGVDKKLEQEHDKERDNIVQRIGILMALQYEHTKGRNARELGESEKLGYDIESKSTTEERYIEVKGKSHSNPDIFITEKEFRVLKNKQDKYFVYVVKDALKNPTLCVTQAEKLLEIPDTKIIISFNKWNNVKDDECNYSALF